MDATYKAHFLGHIDGPISEEHSGVAKVVSLILIPMALQRHQNGSHVDIYSLPDVRHIRTFAVSNSIALSA
jgi:hypothetical protein